MILTIWDKNANGFGDSSYLLNRGTLFPDVDENGIRNSLGRTNGFIVSAQSNTHPSDITDGLATTIAMSERLVISEGIINDNSKMSRIEGLRYLWWTEQRHVEVGGEAMAAEQALHRRTTTWPQAVLGLSFSYVSSFWYDHILVPNSFGSHNGPEDYDSNKYSYCKIIPASSLHFGGVNCLFSDGSVRFLNEAIDLGVWRAFGTRNAGDAITE